MSSQLKFSIVLGVIFCLGIIGLIKLEQPYRFLFNKVSEENSN